MKYLFLSMGILGAAIYFAVSYRGTDPAARRVQDFNNLQPILVKETFVRSDASGHDSLDIPELASRKVVRSNGIPGGKYRALAIDDGWNFDCYLVEVEAKKIKFSFSGPAKDLYFAAISPRETYLASGKVFEKQIVLWDIESGKVAKELAGHETYTGLVAFSPDESQLASLSIDGEVFVWNLDTLSKIEEWTVDCDEVHSLEFTSEGVKALREDGTELNRL